VRAQQRRHGARHAGNDGAIVVVLALFRLDTRPIAQHLGRVLHLAVAEHVGVAPDHLLVDAMHDICDSKMSGLARQLGVKDNLQQQVPQLGPQLVEVAVFDRLGHFVSLLDHVRLERLVRLLAVPGTAVRATQALHDANQFGERFSGTHLTISASPGFPTSQRGAAVDGDAVRTVLRALRARPALPFDRAVPACHSIALTLRSRQQVTRETVTGPWPGS
jgi:hypothetical protein